MFRIDGPNTVSVKPAYGAAGTQGWFKNYGVGGTLDGPGTIVTPDFLNMLQAELLAVISAAGLTPDKANDAQLLAALDARYAGVAIGDVVVTGRASPNASELRANGAAISRATYAALFAAYGETFGVGDGVNTFNLPNLEGEFIRIFDNGRGVDVGRVLGTAQLDALQGHVHDVTSAVHSGLTGLAQPSPGLYLAAVTATTTGPLSDGSNGTPRIAAETRPRNLALNAFVRAI